MEISSSLKRKSILALGVYLFFFIAMIGTVTYLVVEPLVRSKLEQSLDLKTELLASQLEQPLNSAIGVLHGIASIGEANHSQKIQAKILSSLFKTLDGAVVSGGLWPEPYTIDKDISYMSLYYNRSSDGQVDNIKSWNNPSTGGYVQEAWYTVAVDAPKGSVFWSEVYIDAYTHIQMISITSPYYIDDQFSGVATVDLSLADLIDFIQNNAKEHDLGFILRDGLNEVITEHNFKKSDTIYISSHQFGEFKWMIDVVNAKRTVNDNVYALVTSIELSIMPILLLCVMAGYYLINQFLIRPIVLIAKKVDASKEGGIIEVAYRSNDEIRRLIDTFNQKTVYLEAEKVKAQASTKAKSAFLAVLSHEIRTPMNGVLGTAQILLKSNLTPDQRKHLKSLQESGEHMMTLLNEILDFSKIEQGHLEFERTPFPIDSIIGSINSVYHTLCTEKGLQFKVYSEIPSGRWYNADKARLRQILFNLLNNAVKFTSRGFVEVYLKEKMVGEQLHLLIKVRDTGIGISKEAQGRVFKPFEQAESSTTRRFGGTGLGLAIVKQIVELNGGGVSVTSEMGIGTSFEVSLLIEATSSGSVELNVHRKLNYSGLKVLIVEDNRTNTIIIETFMKGKGFECDCVENGEQALVAVAQTQYDLILMDNHMPVMDGVEATSNIRSMNDDRNKVLIFGCTADVFIETRERMLSAGTDYIISKPIDDSALDDALYRYASKLYQYHSEKSLGSEVLISEEVLVRFYVELDNQHFFQAKEIIEDIAITLAPYEDQVLMDKLKEIVRCLELEEQPQTEDVDVITVMLSKYCN
ncbi:hybrid sensor histidine kinase/response regulator [Vibrio genomosp. F10]|uniref:hybrid sensor histidine kinase/response regulator n=1 Tax=Vibrio genomosp. F10 TaxID=723171 RepID=UPI00084BF268|nr:ATP-binding protein [Vibrio genomosp. F10]OEF06331.1 histidine kinase [Vibrio genomosp. F10 str. 9ZD137]